MRKTLTKKAKRGAAKQIGSRWTQSDKDLHVKCDATITRLGGFVQIVARLDKDRECHECHKSGDIPNPACDDHAAFDMPSDDAYDTLHSLISEARRLLTPAALPKAKATKQPQVHHSDDDCQPECEKCGAAIGEEHEHAPCLDEPDESPYCVCVECAAKDGSEDRNRWCVLCQEWVFTMPDGEGCRQCWNPTMSEEEKNDADRN